jgi:predicted RNase H-like HicB family nuclease
LLQSCLHSWPDTPELPGVGVVGDTREDVDRLVREAVELRLEGLRAAGEAIPPPAAVATALVGVSVA